MPVIISSENKKIKVNALLDDGSTKSYINADIIAELGIQAEFKKVKVNVLNGKTEVFETMPVTVTLESLNEQYKTEMNAFTTDKVTGNLKGIDWTNYQTKWGHLKEIQFPRLSSRPIIDILIGTDYSDLHYSHDIEGLPGEPVARLTPLGWTCIGNTDVSNTNDTHFSSFFTHDRSGTTEISEILRSFWEVESSGTLPCSVLSKKYQKALEIAENSLEYTDGRYRVAVRWKESALALYDNYQMAMKRLENTEKEVKQKSRCCKIV